MTPYLVASLVACLIVLCGIAFCIHTHNSVLRHIRADLQSAEHSHHETNDLIEALDHREIRSLNLDLPVSMQVRINVADWIFRFRHVCVITAFVVCIFAARLLIYQHRT